MRENARVSNPYAPPKEGAARPDLRPEAPRAPRDPGGRAGGPGPRSPRDPRPPAPPREPPDPDQVRRASRQLLHFWLLVLGAVVTFNLPLPWKAGALVLVGAALVVGGLALVTTWRARLPGLMLPMIVAGLGFAGLTGAAALSTIAMWPLVQDREECLRGALTVSAQAECEQAFQDGLAERTVDLERIMRSRPAGG